METPSNNAPRPDREKVHHLFNGLRNGGVNPDTARVGLEVEFNKAFAYMDAADRAIDDLVILLETANAKVASPNSGPQAEGLDERKADKKDEADSV